jgi:hypothetical protein
MKLRYASIFILLVTALGVITSCAAVEDTIVPSVQSESIGLSETAVALSVEETTWVTVFGVPTENVSWKINLPDIATVNNGVVTALEVGDAVLSAWETTNVLNMATASVKVSLFAKPVSDLAVTEETVDH